MAACPRCQVPLPPEGVCPACGPPSAQAPTKAPPSDRGSDQATQIEAARRDPRRTVGRYLLLDELGRGGMGVVWRAWEDRLRRVVAIKTLLSDDPGAQKRFQREAEAVARLRHPNIVAVHEVGEHQGRPFLVMDWIDGTTLARRLRPAPGAAPEPGEERLSLTRALEILRDVAFAVHHAHEQGVIHRDLKPHNVMIDRRGHPLVMDFGLARVRGGSHSQLTRTGSGMGTLAYMPPEQAEGGEVDERADVYALGATLYHVLTGRPPFYGSDVNVLHALFTKDPHPPSTLNPRAAGDLETICLRCLEKDPARRYASAKALADDLERHLAGDPIAARPLSAAQRLWRRARRQKLAAAALVLAALCALAGAGGVAWQYRATLAALDRAEVAQGRASKDAETARTEAHKAVRQLMRVFLDRARQAILSGQRGQAAVYAAHALEQVDKLPEAERGPLRDSGHAALAVARSGFWRRGSQVLDQVAMTLVADRPRDRVAWAALDGSISLREGDAPPVRLLEPRGNGQHVALAFSRNGDLAALVGSSTSGSPREVLVWQGAGGPARRVMEGVTSRALAWSPDGRSLALVGEGPRLILLEVPTGVAREMKLVPVHVPADIAVWYAVAWDPSGSTLVVAGSEQNVHFIDLAAGRISPRSGHHGAIQVIAFHPDLPLLASADSEGVVLLWPFQPGQEAGMVTRWQDLSSRGQRAGFHSLEWSPDGTHLAAACYDGSVRVWSGLAGALADVVPGTAEAAVWTAEGGLLVASGTAGLVRIRPEPVVVREVLGSGFQTEISNQISALAWSADGSRLASGREGGDKRLIVLSAPDWRAGILGVIPGSSSESRIANGLAPIGVEAAPAFALATSEDQLWSCAVGRPPTALGWGWAVASHGHRLAIGARRGKIRVQDPDRGEVELGTHRTDTDLQNLAFLGPDRLLSTSGSGLIEMHDLASRTATWRSPRYEGLQVTAAAPDARSFVALVRRRVLWFVLDDAGQPALKRERTFEGPLASCAWAPARLVALGFEDGRLALYDPLRDEIRAELPGHRGQVRSLAWSPPDGAILASGGADTTVRLWREAGLIGDAGAIALRELEVAAGWEIPEGSVDPVLIESR